MEVNQIFENVYISIELLNQNHNLKWLELFSYTKVCILSSINFILIKFLPQSILFLEMVEELLEHHLICQLFVPLLTKNQD